MWKRSALAALGILGTVALAGCDDVNSAIDQADRAADRASVCTEALGLVNLNPNVDPQQLQAEAEEKANRLRELGQQAADQEVQQSLQQLADSYVELEQKQATAAGEFNQWLQNSMKQLDELRQACL
ncbi:hypothetical protein B0I33_111265 [Prauserella shujinwangii]|uniref:Uncharacterized protein n=1 Tax=Prauserella shujinwangii TaxID=1453103 RepID=A0A2T0LNJ2_9PSEU|nr:hypothetical protein [Prauserella shujinwangii]PRX44750.1 hypothetical protein B0I33_111265 [Prauserella shujinwangii]